MLHNNNVILINELENLPLLDSRYSNIQHVNMPSGIRRGNFSLVFKAYDEVNEENVALKFFDLDPTKQQRYRLECFDREHSILNLLLHAQRCLQVRSPLQQYILNIPSLGGGAPFSVAAKYFVVEWLEYDIDSYFLDQSSYEAIEKLQVFNEIVLAVEALHSRSVFHRDLKADNLRASSDGGPQRRIVAIDLGTAAQVESPAIATYIAPAGLHLYSSPEAFCGLAGHRQIGFLSDVYALGCLLFELFCHDDFYTAYRNSNPDFDMRLTACQARIDPKAMGDLQLKIWDREVPMLFAGLAAVDVEQAGSSVPPAIYELLSHLVGEMTKPNFRDRSKSLSRVRSLLWSCIRCLSNEAVAKKRAAQAKERRRVRKERAIAKAARIESRRLSSSTEVQNGTIQGP